MKMLKPLGQYLQTKRNFMIYWFIVVGIPIAVLFVWIFAKYRGVIYWLLLAFGCAYVSGLLMWRFFWGVRGDSDKN